MDYLKSELQVTRWKRDGIRIKGQVQAGITQACVVTLEPVPSVIDEKGRADFRAGRFEARAHDDE